MRARARVRCKGQCSSVLAALGRVRNSCRPPPGSGPADCRGESAFYIDKYQRKRMFNCVQIGWLSAALRTINIVITIVVIERARVEPDGGRRTRRPELFKFKFRPHENAIVPRVQSQYACNLITYTFTNTTHMCVCVAHVMSQHALRGNAQSAAQADTQIDILFSHSHTHEKKQ